MNSNAISMCFKLMRQIEQAFDQSCCRMEDTKLKELLNSLRSNEMSSYQMEKQSHKWIGHILKRIHGKFLDDYRAVEVVHQILCQATKNNQIHILAPHVLNWCNDILSRVTQAANPNTYLSILALFLRYNPLLYLGVLSWSIKL